MKRKIYLVVAMGVAIAFSVLLDPAFGQNCIRKSDGTFDCNNCNTQKQGVNPRWQVVRPDRVVRPGQPVARAHPAVCRIFADRAVTHGGRKAVETSVGSGVLVWRGTKKGLVLTVHHLFRQKPTRVIVEFPDGQRYEAEQVQTEDDPDLGALTIPRPDIEPMQISEDAPPRQGDRVTLCGFDGATKSYSLVAGTVLGYTSHKNSDGAWTSNSDLLMTGGAKEGNSGGPIIDARGELVAILWGTDDVTSRGSYAGRICQFLTSDKFVPPWGDSKIAPWNARTEQESIRSQAAIEQERIRSDALSRIPLPTIPAVANAGTVDMVAQRMAQDALYQVDTLEKRVGSIEEFTGSTLKVIDRKAQDAVDQTKKTAEGLGTLETGLLSKVKAYTFGLVKSWGFGGGLIMTGVFGLAFFLIRRQGMLLAQFVDKVTDIIPGNWDDKILDPLAYKLAGIISGKPIPDYAHTPGLDPWGRPYDPWGRPYTGQQSPPPPVQPQAPSATASFLADMQSQIDALKKSQPSA